jgi:hypothetical protein
VEVGASFSSERMPGKAQQKIVLRVLGEEQGSPLAAGRAEMKAFAAERTEELLSAFRVSALYAGDSPGWSFEETPW